MGYCQQYPKNKSKFNSVVERKLEGACSQSQALGWNYGDFVQSILEILVIIQHRQKSKHLVEVNKVEPNRDDDWS
jgi:hypothetical protein